MLFLTSTKRTFNGLTLQLLTSSLSLSLSILLIQESMLPIVVSSFQHIFGHTHWLVFHNTQEAFRRFVEVTPPTEVEQCVLLTISSIVVGLLHKVNVDNT